jgi:FtsP/CotA-like multicopper oxidase with cupredoxin domain
MLTTGKQRPKSKAEPRLVSIVTVHGHDESTVLALAGSLARALDGPLAAAIVESAGERDIQTPDVDRLHEATTEGVAARVGGRAAALGTSAFFSDLGIATASFGNWPERLRRRGEHVLFVAVDRRTAGLFGVMGMEDEMREALSISDHFPTSTAGLPAAHAPVTLDLSDDDRLDLRIAPVAKSIGRATVRMLAYNGSIPGPTFRVQQGSTLLVNVVNEGDLEATVHWHGLRLDNRYDGTTATQRPIRVGGGFTYRLEFPDPGIYWYHPHIREDYGQEVGLYGTIVVVPSERDYWPPVNRELTLTLDDILLEDGKVASFDRSGPTFAAMGRFGNTLLVNGEPELALCAKQDEVVRFYLVNTANTRVFNVGVRGARMKLVGGDSGRYERETLVDSVVIAPAERAVVDVVFEQPGRVILEHRTPQRTYRLATVDVSDEPAAPYLVGEFDQLRTHSDMTAERARLTSYLIAPPDKTLAFVAAMQVGEPQLAPGAAASYVCPMHADVVSEEPGRCPKCGMKLLPAHLVDVASHGDHAHAHASDGDAHDSGSGHAHYPAGIEWEDDMVDVNRMTNRRNMRWKLIDRRTGAAGGSIDWRFRVGDRVKIRLVNEMDSDHPMHHPFHIHGAGRFLILSRDGVVETNLVWKDTVLVPTGQTFDILLDITHPGAWMAHCHIAEHHESGMMLTFRVDA